MTPAPDLAAAVAARDVAAVEAALSAGSAPDTSIVMTAVAATRDSPSLAALATLRSLLNTSAPAVDDAVLVRAVGYGVPTTTLRLLLEHGADPQARRSDGMPVLVLAAARDHGGLVDELLRRGAKVDAPDRRGRTALMHAVERGFTGVVASLMCAGADPLRGALDGATAHSLARAWGRQRILAMMGDRVVGPDLVDAPRTVIDQVATAVHLRTEGDLLKQVAALIDHVTTELEGQLHTYTGFTDEQGRQVADLLRHPDEVPGSSTLKSVDLTRSQQQLIREVLLALAHGSPMRLPVGWTRPEIADLFHDIDRFG